jgi:hypothetical protein
MSTAAATGRATYTGANGSNGTTATAQPNNATTFVASSVTGQANYVSVAVPTAATPANYAGTSFGLTSNHLVAGPSTYNGLGTQGAVASGSNPPSYNPGS